MHPVETPIQAEQQVVFFPTCGRRHADGRHWELPIHGWAFRPGVHSLRRRALLNLLRRGLKLDRQQAEAATFSRRARAFLAANSRGKRVTIRVADSLHRLEASGKNGHFQGLVRLRAELVEELLQDQPAGPHWLPFSADEREHPGVAGAVRLLDQAGVSIVSDIDDTIKITEVHSKRALLRRTFVTDFEAVAGMAPLYARWEAQGAAFHFVSASPWQLYAPLSSFALEEGFPSATYHLRHFRLRDSAFLDLLAAADKAKTRTIAALLTAFPRRRFVLIGDSGQRDPEIYANIARRFSHQVARVFIRNVHGGPPDMPRYERLFHPVLPDHAWQVFDHAAELWSFKLSEVQDGA